MAARVSALANTRYPLPRFRRTARSTRRRLLRRARTKAVRREKMRTSAPPSCWSRRRCWARPPRRSAARSRTTPCHPTCDGYDITRLRRRHRCSPRLRAMVLAHSSRRLGGVCRLPRAQGRRCLVPASEHLGAILNLSWPTTTLADYKPLYSSGRLCSGQLRWDVDGFGSSCGSSPCRCLAPCPFSPPCPHTPHGCCCSTLGHCVGATTESWQRRVRALVADTVRQPHATLPPPLRLHRPPWHSRISWTPAAPTPTISFS